jgi:hypothetical protein
MSKPKICKIKKNLIGEVVPHRESGRTGQYVEELHADAGMPVQPDEGPDYPEFDLEMKSKSKESKSAYTIGSMSRYKIVNMPYSQSPIKRKLQQHYHVYHKDEAITDQITYDFRADYIQEELERAYETARQKIINGESGYVSGTQFGYFEERKKSPGNYQFRISVKGMEALKNLENPKFREFFEFV